jgi:hypothetical protein
MPKITKGFEEGSGDNLPEKRGESPNLKIPMIYEPRCKVCTSSMRNEIELMVVRGYNLSEIARQVQAAGEDISSKSVERHRRNHMDMQRSAFRTIMEKQAKELGELEAQGAVRIVSGKAWLDIFVQQATDRLIAGEMEIEARDVVKAIELREALEEKGINIFQEQIMVELRAIIQAMKEVIGQELAREIGIRAKELAAEMRHAELEAETEDAEYEVM